MDSCNCHKYRAALLTRQDVEQRCRVTVDQEIRVTLEKIAADSKTWMSVYRCRVCGTFWTEEYLFSERHGGGPRCLYVIQTDDPQTWLSTATGITLK